MPRNLAGQSSSTSKLPSPSRAVHIQPVQPSRASPLVYQPSRLLFLYHHHHCHYHFCWPSQLLPTNRGASKSYIPQPCRTKYNRNRININTMEQAYPISRSPRRLSERRGKPELQPLDPVLPPKITTYSGTITDADIESSDSSLPSGVFTPGNYATPSLSAPVTPTDLSPLRSLGPFGTIGSTIVGSSIQEEEESNCGCADCEARCGEYGLGLAVGAAGTMGTKDVAFPRLDTISAVREGFEGPCCGTHYHLNEKLAPVAMPPTPPSNCTS